MDPPDDSLCTINMTLTGPCRRLPREEGFEVTKYLALSLGLGVGVLIVAIGVMAAVVVRMLKKIKRTGDGQEERVTEGNDEPDGNFPETTQHTQPSRNQNDRVAWRFRNTFENRAVAHQENFALENEFDNANTMQNDTTTTTRTPLQYTPRSSPSSCDDAEFRQQRSPPLQNTIDGSFTSPSSPESVSENDDTANTPLYDRPPNTAVPIAGATHDVHLYDRPRKSPVPVNETTQDESIYQRPKNTPVPVNDCTLDAPLYDRPPQNPVPVNGATHDQCTYDRPAYTIVPVSDDTEDSVYERLYNTAVPVSDDTQDSVYERLYNTAMPVSDDTQDSVYERLCNTAVPVSDDTQDSVYGHLSSLPVPLNDSTNDSPLYDSPSSVPVSVNGAKRNQTPQDYPSRPPCYPRPAPRPSKSARKVQENFY